jgi:hypothetical protein
MQAPADNELAARVPARLPTFGRTTSCGPVVGTARYWLRLPFRPLLVVLPSQRLAPMDENH